MVLSSEWEMDAVTKKDCKAKKCAKPYCPEGNFQHGSHHSLLAMKLGQPIPYALRIGKSNKERPARRAGLLSAAISLLYINATSESERYCAYGSVRTFSQTAFVTCHSPAFLFEWLEVGTNTHTFHIDESSALNPLQDPALNPARVRFSSHRNLLVLTIAYSIPS